MYRPSAVSEKIGPITRDQYKYILIKLCDVQREAKGKVRNILYRDVHNGMSNRVYDTLVRTHRVQGGDGMQMANHVLSVAKRVWSVANKWEVIHRNPWKFVEKLEPKKRKVSWTEEQVQQFLDTAYSRFE